MPLADVKDEAFASGALGDGIAIEPTDGELVAPEMWIRDSGSLVDSVKEPSSLLHNDEKEIFAYMCTCLLYTSRCV